VGWNEGLIFIALWCGSPGADYNKTQVDRCRHQIMDCLFKKESPSDTLNTLHAKDYLECAQKTKLKEIK
jgi:hypothetical protein